MRIGFSRRAALVPALTGFVALVGIACGDDGLVTPPPILDGEIPDAPGMDGGAVFPESGIGTNGLSLERLVPNHGPFTGGTVVVLRGTGFTDETEVTIDGLAVQPADYDLIDGSRLGIVTPAGEVGDADVVVRRGDDTVTLEAGYHYDAFYVDPDRGAVSGGTLVNIIGQGTTWVDGDTVIFGRTPCDDTTIVSETRITCRTPPMTAGSVDVTVVSAETIEVPDAFTYYDSTDPYAGGLGGGPIAGALNVTVLNAGSGDPVPDAYVLVGEDVAGPYQGLTDINGQITFSDTDLVGPVTVTAAKFCFEKTSVVSFDASDVTIFLVPWMDPMCGMGEPPPPGRGRNGTFISGELVWPSDFGTGPRGWYNVPEPRANEVKVAYVYTTQAGLDIPNPDPTLGGSTQRVLEEIVPEAVNGYPYRIFARPAALAVYALAGLENTATGEFLPYVMGIARNVLGGPGEEVENVDILMQIPLDHTLDVQVSGLPMEGRAGPDSFKIEAYVDLGGEGIIVRNVNNVLFDIVRGRTSTEPFRFWAEPAMLAELADGRYRVIGGWYTGDYDAQPFTIVVERGIREVDSTVVLDDFLGIPIATSPVYGNRLPDDRVLRWSADGPTPDMHVVLMIGGDGNPAWRHFVPGDVREAPIPDLSTIPDIDDISAGFITWVVYAIRIPGFDFNEFTYTYLLERYWSAYSLDYFTATR